MKFKKKPVIVEATQWHKNGDHPQDYAKTIEGLEDGRMRSFSPTFQQRNDWEGQIVRRYRHPDVSGGALCKHCLIVSMRDHGWIDTLEGGHIVCPGDWIITGVKGENYPCKSDIFEATYEPAGDGAEGIWRAEGQGAPAP